MTRAAALAWVGLALAVGALLRAIPCWNDFWLDEVWTYLLAQRLHSPLDVFTAIHHSNNHHLNTLLVYWTGEARHWSVYRLPSLLTGIGSIALAAGFAWRRGRLEAVLAAALVAGCFALIHFSSEARGSGLAVFFALAALWLLELDLARPRAWTAALFGACVGLGYLSQLVFLFFYTGALVHSALRLVRRAGVGRAAALGLARLHAAPLLGFAWLYWVDLRRLSVGSGPPPDAAWLLSRVFGFGFGLPVWRQAGWLYAALGAALLLLGLERLRRQGDGLWWLFLITILLAPMAAIGAFRPDVVAVRYFLIGIALALLLLAYALADALRAGGWRRVAAVVMLLAFAVGNGVHTGRFLALGRGGFRAALRMMAERTPGPRVEVGSDHDFRNGSVLRFYARELPPGKTLDYRSHKRWPPGGPEWLVIHRQERPEQVQPTLSLRPGERYALVAEFDHAAISGFYWAVYRNAAAPSSPAGPR